MYTQIFLLACLAVACNAQLPFWGPCPMIPPKINFNAQLLYGKWYEAEKYFSINQVAGKCGAVTYTGLFPGIIRTNNHEINVFTNIPRVIEGTASMIGGPTVASLSVVFTGYPPSVVPSNYMVVETDYTTFAIIYSCVNLHFLNYKNVWILTRARFSTPEILANAYAVMDAYILPRGYLTKSDQLNCPVDH